MSHLHDLYTHYGQSAWIDNIRRDWLDDGTLAQLVTDGARGVTSNPAIFAKAFATSSLYDALIAAQDTTDPEVVFERLAVADVRDACDIVRPVYDASVADQAADRRRFRDGYVSLEVSPRLARDTAATSAAAERLAGEVDRPNLMIKIPATVEGLPAITATLAKGINVNVTLIFSLERYQAVLDAWTDGVEQALAAGLDVTALGSVASFFVSRVDAAVDPLLAEDDDRRGVVANAQVAAAYETYLAHVASPRVQALLARGAQVQRPLWASTSTKNPNYPDLLYVNTIVADETVNTMPDATLAASLDHGEFAKTEIADPAKRRALASVLDTLVGQVDLAEVTATLERDGVRSFEQSYEELLALVASKVRTDD
jgi:transaldolase